MRKRIKPKPVSLESYGFRTWKRSAPVVPERPPLSERMPVRVPPGSTTLSADGTTLLTKTPTGTVIAWDLCGSCGVNVKSCKCSRPSPTRSVTYIWYQDDALQRGESWDPSHPNYSERFPVFEHEEPEIRRVRKRVRRKPR